ncbi:acyl-CoA N-acyltransferase [Blastocladiella britannica]|nr:acyl-CoA N-acyltransferase [Blastocladiella britannica]
MYALSHPSTAAHMSPTEHVYFGGLTYGPFASVAEYRDYYRRRHFSDPLSIMYAVHATVSPDGTTPLSQNRLIGQLGFISTVPVHKRLEIGHVWYDVEYRGTFANKAAVATLLAYAIEQLGFVRVEWRCNQTNKGSFGAARSIGFEHEGTFKKHMQNKGADRATLMLALTDDEWYAGIRDKLYARLGVETGIETSAA